MKMTNSPGCLQQFVKDADQTVPPHSPMPVFIQPGMFYSLSFDTRILDYKTSH